MEVDMRKVGQYIELVFKIDNTRIETGLLSIDEANEYLIPMKDACECIEEFFKPNSEL